jgi:hypothetical protein
MTGRMKASQSGMPFVCVPASEPTRKSGTTKISEATAERTAATLAF